VVVGHRQAVCDIADRVVVVGSESHAAV
jgi:hypothetical protein